MKLNIKDDLKYYTFKHFEEKSYIKHCFSTKFGGVSEGFYKSMNLSFRNDKRENVIQNYKIICDAIGCNYKNVVFSSQVHKDNIYQVTKADVGKGFLVQSDFYGYDALITNEPEVILVTFCADCVPIFVLDPVRKAIAIIHSGWRGTALEIAKKTILKMQEIYKTYPNDVLVGIGPSISSCCFEVDMPVVKEFKDNLPFAEKYIFAEKNEKFKIDLKNIIKENIMSIGVLEKNIEISNLCTVCNSDIFFSHRVMGENRGSLAGLMQLKL